MGKGGLVECMWYIARKTNGKNYELRDKMPFNFGADKLLQAQGCVFFQFKKRTNKSTNARWPYEMVVYLFGGDLAQDVTLTHL
mmetsp:Transcript_12672/g.24382  ORF Transcript_12672/g.24382 Transcript_12672/m.24382 type:complete len:83 (-) Transcript_12672:1576-1824(-)